MECPENKVFINEGKCQSDASYFVQKDGKCGADLQPNNMVLSSYEGKTKNILRVIQVELAGGTTTRSTLFILINSKANYNLLLGRE